jgi:hypothetical protein
VDKMESCGIVKLYKETFNYRSYILVPPKNSISMKRWS